MKKILFIILLFAQGITYGQGSGPHTFPLPPKDLTAINFFYLDLGSNVSPSKDVILDNGIIDIDAFALPIIRTFSLGGQLAQVFIVPGVGHLSGIIESGNQQSEIADIDGFMIV